MMMLMLMMMLIVEKLIKYKIIDQTEHVKEGLDDVDVAMKEADRKIKSIDK